MLGLLVRIIQILSDLCTQVLSVCYCSYESYSHQIPQILEYFSAFRHTLSGPVKLPMGLAICKGGGAEGCGRGRASFRALIVVTQPLPKKSNIRIKLDWHTFRESTVFIRL